MGSETGPNQPNFFHWLTLVKALRGAHRRQRRGGGGEPRGLCVARAGYCDRGRQRIEGARRSDLPGLPGEIWRLFRVLADTPGEGGYMWVPRLGSLAPRVTGNLAWSRLPAFHCGTHGLAPGATKVATCVPLTLGAASARFATASSEEMLATDAVADIGSASVSACAWHRSLDFAQRAAGSVESGW